MEVCNELYCPAALATPGEELRYLLNRRSGTHIIMNWSSMGNGGWLVDGFILGIADSVTLKVEEIRCSKSRNTRLLPGAEARKNISWPTTSGVKIWKVWLICGVGRHLQGDEWVSGSRDAPWLEFPASRGICHSWLRGRLKKKEHLSLRFSVFCYCVRWESIQRKKVDPRVGHESLDGK